MEKATLFNVPILFLVFNRPEHTHKVFERIREIRPKYLYISADGPRDSKKGEFEKCIETRSIVEKVDWPCEVKTRFLEKNLGCKLGVSSGISWFFENVEEGIILEDDCLVDKTFFYFSEELLEKYRNNSEVMHISASNFQEKTEINTSYYFSRFNHIWGWATWRRAWKNYDVHLNQTNRKDFKKVLWGLFNRKIDIPFWLSMYDYAKSKNFTTWDFQWTFSMWLKGGISITPAANLVSNIGFGEGATNTQGVDLSFSQQQSSPIAFPLKHPEKRSVKKEADAYAADFLYRISKNAQTFNLKIKIARILPISVRNFIKKLL